MCVGCTAGSQPGAKQARQICPEQPGLNCPGRRRGCPRSAAEPTARPFSTQRQLPSDTAVEGVKLHLPPSPRSPDPSPVWALHPKRAHGLSVCCPVTSSLEDRESCSGLSPAGELRDTRDLCLPQEHTQAREATSPALGLLSPALPLLAGAVLPKEVTNTLHCLLASEIILWQPPIPKSLPSTGLHRGGLWPPPHGHGVGHATSPQWPFPNCNMEATPSQPQLPVAASEAHVLGGAVRVCVFHAQCGLLATEPPIQGPWPPTRPALLPP